MKSNNSSILKTVNTLLTNTEIDWQKLLETVVSNFDCTTGTLHFLDEKTQLLLVQAHAGVPDFLLPKLAAIPIGKGMAGIAAERKKPVEMCTQETKVEGSVAAPLILDEVLYGVIGVGKRVPYDFTATETRELMAIGEAISGVLKK
jgi:L-methionine (R)-S-oxide reductase